MIIKVRIYRDKKKILHHKIKQKIKNYKERKIKNRICMYMTTIK